MEAIMKKPIHAAVRAAGGTDSFTEKAEPFPTKDDRADHHSWMDPATKALVFLFPVHLILLFFLINAGDTAILFWRNSLFLQGKTLVLLSFLLLSVYLSIFVWRVVLMLRYRPAQACSDEELPTCTVIVPAYNEGRQVFETIRSIVQSDFPPEKMSIIAVDDGSVDDTWYWMKKAAKDFQGQVRLRRQPVNQGKRRALYEGFRRGRGDIFVTIDSDSQVEPQTLRRLLSPFHHDPLVGAVAGNVRVLNRAQGIIPRMLDVSFTYSFDFIRAGQSVVNSVLCTPGALSAYRREHVLPVSSEWLNQTFCGRPANIGEDRALTNLILRSGYHVHFQQDAVVYTEVPTGYRTLCRMFLRWARSNIRETIVMSRFAFRRFRKTPAAGARVNLLIGWLNLSVGQGVKVLGAIHLFLIPQFFGLNLLLGAALGALAPAILYAFRYRSIQGVWAWPYSLFWLFGLAWIGMYAVITPHKNGWLTRQAPSRRNHFSRPPFGRRGVSKGRLVRAGGGSGIL
jgi:hyaluronan synthase